MSVELSETAAPVPAGAEQRRRLLDGLATSIREKGLVETRVTDIVRHARASRRTFYNVFADKEACCLALAEELSRDVFDGVVASIDESLPWQEQVERAIDTYLGILAGDRAVTITFALELVVLGEPGQELRRQAIERYADFVVSLTRTVAMREAGVQEVSRHAAIMLIGGINELVGIALSRGERLESLAPAAKAVVERVLAPG